MKLYTTKNGITFTGTPKPHWVEYTPTVPEGYDGPASINGDFTISFRTQATLNAAYPLKAPLEWSTLGGGFAIVSVKQEGNYFALLENTPERLWLEARGRAKVEIGDTIVCRERGGSQEVEVREVLRLPDGKNMDGRPWYKSYVRGRWTGVGYYLPVREFLSGMPTIEDIAHSRKPGDAKYQGSI